MALTQIHAGLANTAVMFVAVLGIWALFLRITNRPLDASWMGAAVVGEIVLVAQGVIGGLLYLQGLDATLARPYMHILYGAVAVVTLPAAYGYFGGIENDKVTTLAMAATCFFLWRILLPASNVAEFFGPPL